MLTALSRPESFPWPCGALVHRETHLSDVFLAGRYAFKLKKPVRFAFADFSSRERRRTACEEELRLNRRLAPEVYLAVLPVWSARNRFGLGPPPAGAVIVDHGVLMRRLPEAGMLDQVAAAGRLTEAHCVALAERLARFHAEVQLGAEAATCGSFVGLARKFDANLAELEGLAMRPLHGDLGERLRACFDRALRRHRSLLSRRAAAGRIVDGHGDLHLGNLCLKGGRIVVFDCLEFDAALRCGDAIEDIAFLSMDLEAHGLPGHANRFVNAYVEAALDYEGAALLDLYQLHRALVRAKVRALAGLPAEAQRYLTLAENYLAPRACFLVITCGLSASGKSTAARALAALSGAVVVRSDAVRKQLAGLPAAAHAPAAYGEGLYTPARTTAVYTAMANYAQALISAGRPVVLDASFLLRQQRAAAASLARSLDVPFGILYCTAPPAVLRARLAQRVDISDADAQVLEAQRANFEPPAAGEGMLLPCEGDRALEALRAARA